jgi:hypothetical protein
MNEIQTITDIRDVKNKIKKGIKTINTADYAGQKFGNEQEYTYEGLLDGVDSLLTISISSTLPLFSTIKFKSSKDFENSCFFLVNSDSFIV